MNIKTNRKIKSFYADNKLAILAVAGLFLLWKFWDVLSGLLGLVKAPVDALSAAAASASSGVKTAAQAASDKNTISASLPQNGPVKPYQATTADTIRYRAAAAQCATALGTTPGQLSNVLITDDAALYSAIKPYAKQMWGAGGRALVTKAGAPVLRPLAARYDVVIAPFYQQLTGRSLQVDLDAAFPASPGFAASSAFKDRCLYYRKHIRV